jgi:hypothetical protein
MTQTQEAELDEFEQYIENRHVQQPYPQNIELHPYGLVCYDRGVRLRAGRHIFGVDKGLGKTILALLIARHFNAYPLIVLTTGRGLRTYKKETEKWLPEDAAKVQLVYAPKSAVGDKGRAIRAQQWGNPEAKVFVIPAATLLSDSARRTGKHVNTTDAVPQWVWKSPGWIFDEFHRYMRHKDSATFKLLKQHLAYSPRPLVKIFLSGSAITTGPQDIWPALNILDPRTWSSYWKYVNMFCLIDDSGYGKTILGPKNIPQWQNAVAPWFTSVKKHQVAKHLKDKVRLPLEYELEPWQRKLYESLREDSLAELPDGDFIVRANELAALHAARMALVCPKALNEQLGVGAAIEAVADEFAENDISKYVIYTPYRAPCDHFADYLRNARNLPTWILRGGVNPIEQEEIIKAWSQSPTGVIVCTIKYAESFELAPYASYCAFIGYEWDKDENEQAEDRLHRLTSEDTCFAYYCQCQDTFDIDLWEYIMAKGWNVTRLLTYPKHIKTLLTKGAKAMVTESVAD